MMPIKLLMPILLKSNAPSHDSMYQPRVTIFHFIVLPVYETGVLNVDLESRTRHVELELSEHFRMENAETADRSTLHDDIRTSSWEIGGI